MSFTRSRGCASPVVLLNETFDEESDTWASRTEVGSTRDTLYTGVESTDDDDTDDDDEDGSDGKNLEEIWDEKDLLDEFVKPRKAKNFVIGHYYRKALGSLERS